MQQTIYNHSGSTLSLSDDLSLSYPGAMTAKRRARLGFWEGLARGIARRWELAGVLALMASSAVYGAFALAHLGL